MSIDSDDVFVGLRVIAFFAGLIILGWGLATMGNLDNSDILLAISQGVKAPVAVIVGLFLMILAIVPSAISAVLHARL